MCSTNVQFYEWEREDTKEEEKMLGSSQVGEINGDLCEGIAGYREVFSRVGKYFPGYREVFCWV